MGKIRDRSPVETNYKRLYGKMSDNKKQTYNLEGNIIPESSCIGGRWEYIMKYRAVIINNKTYYQDYYQAVWCPDECHLENVQERLEICTGESARV